MTTDPKELQAILKDAAPPDLELAFRAMFGGIMAYAKGVPFASLSDVGLALKLAGAGHAALLQIEGASALRYAEDQPASKTYVVVPASLLADRLGLRGWVVRCVNELKPKKPPSKRRS